MKIENIPFERSFASHPKSKFWSNKNNLKPSNVFKKINKKFLFNCDICNHEFYATLNNVNNGNWCSFCSNKILCEDKNCDECFNKSFASLSKSKFWSNKNDLTTRQIFKGTSNKYWFNCTKCNHEFEVRLSSVTTNNSWCPYCSGHKLCENKNCDECFNKSFASHPKSKFWSNNNKVKPIQVFISSSNKYLFNCITCNHEFKMSIQNIYNRDSWCNYCSNNILCKDKNCDECFNKSFASHSKSKFWSNKNDLTTRQIFKGTSNKYWFNCTKCNHEFEVRVSSVTTTHNSWCPYCTNQTLCKDKNCDECFNKSFASHSKSKFWSNKNELTTREIFKGTNNKYWFNCTKCNREFNSAIANIVSGSWCPYCKNKTEGILLDWLIKKYKNINYQVLFEWCKNKRKLPFDFVIEEFKLIIELDGIQHYEQVSNWKSPEENQIIDKFKMEKALENDYSIIRIKQEQIWFNTIDWKNILIKHIYKYDNPTIIYI
jgi:DNA-directed RNA polymerase subunit RPC12/RpoP